MIRIRVRFIVSTEHVELIGVFWPMQLVPGHGPSAQGCGVMCVIVPP